VGERWSHFLEEREPRAKAAIGGGGEKEKELKN
jgi:hypothetical protein